ncbi:MAG: hypothetical protein WC832_11875, partial [Anaerolineales bacterium]
MAGRKLRGYQQRIDLRKRLNDFMPKDTPLSSSLDTLLDEGVLWMTRYALLLRIGPGGMRKANGRPLDITVIAHRIYIALPQILAKGVL